MSKDDVKKPIISTPDVMEADDEVLITYSKKRYRPKHRKVPEVTIDSDTPEPSPSASPDIMVLENEVKPSPSKVELLQFDPVLKNTFDSTLLQTSPVRANRFVDSDGCDTTPEISPTKRFEMITAKFAESLKSPGFLARKHAHRRRPGDDENLRDQKPPAKKLQCIAPSDGSGQSKLAFRVPKADDASVTLNRKKKPETKRRQKSPIRELTPEGYWEIDIPDYEEQKRRGYVIETDSPLKAKKPL